MGRPKPGIVFDIISQGTSEEMSSDDATQAFCFGMFQTLFLKTSIYINHLFLAILRVRDLFGMVSLRDLFKGCERDLQLFESPSMAIHILSHGTKFYVPAVSLAEIVSNYKMCS